MPDLYLFNGFGHVVTSSNLVLLLLVVDVASGLSLVAWELSGVHWWVATRSGLIWSSRREILREKAEQQNVLGFSVRATYGVVLTGLSKSSLEVGG